MSMTTDRPAVSNGGSPLPVSLQQARLPRWTPPVLALVAAGRRLRHRTGQPAWTAPSSGA